MFGRYGLRGDRVGEASHPGPVSQFHWISTMPVTSVRDVEAHSLPPTRLDIQWSSSDDEPLLTVDTIVEEDLEASVVSTVPASSRAVRRLVLVGGHAHHEPTSPEVRGPDAAVRAINIADPDCH